MHWCHADVHFMQNSQCQSHTHTEIPGEPCFGFNELWIQLSYLNTSFRIQPLFLLKLVEILSLTLDGKALDFDLIGLKLQDDLRKQYSN